MPRPLTGVVPPLVTPLTAERALDVESLHRLVERLVDAGVDGVFALGSTGEVAFCPPALRREVIAETVRAAAGRVPVAVGVVDTQTPRMLEHAQEAVDLGADAVVATAPFYAATPPEQVRRHFEILGTRCAVPVYAYDLPLGVHQKLDPVVLVDLGCDGLLAGVKDSSGDDVSFRRLAARNRRLGSPLTLFTGHEVAVDGAYLAGAHGSVPGLGNVDPAGYVRLHRAGRAGDWESARHEQDRLARLIEICFVPRRVAGWGAGVGAFKAALHHLGVLGSRQLPEPFEALDGCDAAAVRAVVDRELGPDR